MNTYILDMRLDSYDAYDEATTKKCNDIIKNYHDLFQGLLKYNRILSYKFITFLKRTFHTLYMLVEEQMQSGI